MERVIEADALTYHMPCVVKWLQNESIRTPYYNAYVGPIGYYPGNYELLSLFTVLPFHKDLFVNLVNFFMFVPFGVVIYGILKKLNVSEKVATIAPAIFLTTPIILRQAGIPQNDLFLVFTLAVSVYFLAKILLKERVSQSLALFSITLGLFVGTKSNAIVFGFAIFLIMTVSILVSQRFKAKAFLHISMAFISTFILGGFWYLRNLIVTGNPLFPLDVKLFGVNFFDGYLGFTEKMHGYSMAAHLQDPGLTAKFLESFILSSGSVGVFALVGSALSVLFLLKFKKEYKLLITLFFLSVFFFAVYIISPFSYQNIYPNIRYLLPFILIGFILFIALISKLKRAVFVSYGLAVLTILSTFHLIANQSEYVEYTNDYVFVSFDFPAFRSFDDIFIQDVNADTSDHKYVINRDLIQAFEFVDENIGEDAKIAYTNFGPHYPLFGKNLTREVDYVNVNECTYCIYHDYMYSPDSILRDANYDDWKSNLIEMDKEYLIHADFSDWSQKLEKTWANEHPENFKIIYEEGVVTIYKIDLNASSI